MMEGNRLGSDAWEQEETLCAWLFPSVPQQEIMQGAAHGRRNVLS